MSDAVVETPRLILRKWREDDRAEFYEQLNTPAVMKHLDGLQTREESDAGIDRCIACQDEHGHCLWAVERKEDGALLGFCGIKLITRDTPPGRGSHEIGWRLREDAWGRGYAKEGAIASLDYAFDVLAAPYVVAVTLPANAASWGLMERLGMTRRADLDYYDAEEWGPKVGTEIVYRIEAGQWRALRREIAA